MKIVPIVGIVVLLSAYMLLLSNLILVMNNPEPDAHKSESMGYLKLVPF